MDSGFGTCLNTRSQEDLYIHVSCLNPQRSQDMGGSCVRNSPTFYGQFLSISQIFPKLHAAINTTYNTIYATALHTYLKHMQYKQMYKMCVLYILFYKFPPHWTMLKRPSTVHPPSLPVLRQSTQLTPRRYFRS